MLRTFNCGIGMIVVASKDGAAEAEQALRDAGEKPVRLGEATTFDGSGERVAYRGKLGL